MEKKKVILTGVIIIFLIICVIFIKNSDREKPSQVVFSEYDGIQLEVKAIDYEKQCLSIVFSNQTDEIIWYYPYEWKMEKKEKNTWYTMEQEDDEKVMEGPAIYAQPLEINEMKEITFNWKESYGIISPGTYRVYFWILEEGDNKSYIGVEFTLDKS